MKLQELQQQALKLPISDRWRLVQSLLTSIEQETQASTVSVPKAKTITEELDPWTQSLIGVIQIDDKNHQESYVDYLEEK